jgi:hypothetical protein
MHRKKGRTGYHPQTPQEDVSLGEERRPTQEEMRIIKGAASAIGGDPSLRMWAPGLLTKSRDQNLHFMKINYS